MKRIGLISGQDSQGAIVLKALRKLGKNLYNIESLDQLRPNRPISDAIWSLIQLSDVLVACLSGATDNVFYEIGLAHGLGKPVILVADYTSKLPFDLLSQRVIILERSEPNLALFEFTLAETIAEALKDKTLPIRGPRNRPYQAASSSDPTLGTFRDLFTYEGLARGRALEHWVSTMLEAVKDWEITKSTQASDRGFDFAIWNSWKDSELTMMKNPIAVQCDTGGMANSAKANEILSRAEKSGLKSLIIVSTARITGVRSRPLYQRARAVGIVLVILDREDLIDVQRPSEFVQAIKTHLRHLLAHRET